MRGFFAALLAVATLAACDSPMSANDQAALDISAALGAPVTPFDSGVYRLLRSETSPENSFGVLEDQMVDDSSRPVFANVFVAQFHAPSQSYATPYGNMRFYPFGEETMVLELFGSEGESIFLPARVTEDGTELTIFEYSCSAFSDAQGDAIGLLGRCEIDTIDALLAGMAILEQTDLPTLRFQMIAPLPDRE